MTKADQIRRAKETEAWLRYCSVHSAALPYNQMRVMWPEIKRVMLRRLTYERETLDFGFCRLVPVPLRANWREIIVEKMPKVRWLFRYHFCRRQRQSKVDKFLAGLGLGELLRHPEVVAVQSAFVGESRALDRPVLGWRLEVVESRVWRVFSQEVEVKKRKILTPRQYLQRWKRRAEEIYEDAKVLLLEDLGQARQACADANKIGQNCDGELVPRFPRKRVRMVLDPTEPTHIGLRARRSDRPKKPGVVPPADKNMPEMRDVLPAHADMRGARGNVGEAGECGNAGVLVSDVDQGSGETREVLGAG